MSESTKVLINRQDPTNLYLLTEQDAVRKDKFPQSFLSSFYHIWRFIRDNDDCGKVLSHIVMKMDRNNFLEATIVGLAKELDISEDTVSRRIKVMVLEGVIHKNGKKIMLNPAYTVKCRPSKYGELVDMWYNGIFKPYTPEQEEKEPVVLDIDKIKELLA